MGTVDAFFTCSFSPLRRRVGLVVLAFIIRHMGFSYGHLLLTICNHLTLLCELLDGVYVGLLSDLPLCFFNVVQVEGWLWGG